MLAVEQCGQWGSLGMQVPKIDFHEWELTIIFASGLAFVALTVLSELVAKAKVVCVKTLNFRKPTTENSFAHLFRSLEAKMIPARQSL
jgi:hypothetical protein